MHTDPDSSIYYYQFMIWDSDMDNYLQYHHLLSMKYLNNATVLISDNLFTNLSMAGSLIYLEEGTD